MSVYIIAEAGVNHNGRLDLAFELCKKAKEAGVDAVKFQTWKTELLVTRETQMAEYQKENLSIEESQYDMLKKLELSYDSFLKIKRYCDEIGIQFLSTADEEESLDFIIKLGVPFLKLGSGDITNIPYLRIVGEKGLPVILSTGMSYLGDVERALYILKDAGAPNVILLHCTTDYPCSMENVNLRAMLAMKHAFGVDVGYSDHTMGIEVPVAAVAMGATVIEKHFTLDKKMDGPDHQASLDPIELKLMVQAIRNIEKALGDGVKRPTQVEQEVSKVVLKSIVAKQEIRRGEMLTRDNLTVKRAGKGISSVYWDLILGTSATSDYNIDEEIKL